MCVCVRERESEKVGETREFVCCQTRIEKMKLFAAGACVRVLEDESWKV